jgi:prepilin-type N-terminal cleavage/methylation domain-containing protein
VSARGRRGGFTLVEVLAASAILATTVVILLNAHYTSMNLQTTMQTAADYRRLLETTVSKAEVAVMQGEFAGAGDFGGRHPGYAWSFDAVLVGNDYNQLYEVTARITNGSEEESRTFLVYAIKSAEEAEGGDMFKPKGDGTSSTGKSGSGSGTSDRSTGRDRSSTRDRGSRESAFGSSSRSGRSRGSSGGMFNR